MKRHPTDRAALERDCDMEFFIAGGPGGQHRNKVESGVRLTHRPTGLLVTATERRSQAANREAAFRRMAEKIERSQRVRKRRRATRPTSGSVERRLEAKKRRSRLKQGRSTALMLVLMCLPTATLLGRQMGAEERAVDYLSREVPRWSRENRCFSCHNNGDAARALYQARRLEFAVPVEALDDTTAWLVRPSAWDENRGDPGFSDKKLARIQFSAALADAFLAGEVSDEPALRQAAEALLQQQGADGAWRLEQEAAIGSPATYGSALATALARATLVTAKDARFATAIEGAGRWLSRVPVAATPDAAAAVMALREAAPAAVERLLRGQNGDGGWGPYAKDPSEPFDTALALLALRAVRGRAAAGAVQEGRAFLLRTQLENGGWRETTRPAGGHSYAQHISTTGWVALALLRTR